MRMRSHETQEPKREQSGGERMVEERGGSSAACHPSSAWRTCRLHDSPLCPEQQSSRIYMYILYTAQSVFLRVPCARVFNAWALQPRGNILPRFCHLSQPACVHSPPYGHIWELACYHQLASRLIFKILNLGTLMLHVYRQDKTESLSSFSL